MRKISSAIVIFILLQAILPSHAAAQTVPVCVGPIDIATAGQCAATAAAIYLAVEAVTQKKDQHGRQQFWVQGNNGSWKVPKLQIQSGHGTNIRWHNAHFWIDAKGNWHFNSPQFENTSGHSDWFAWLSVAFVDKSGNIIGENLVIPADNQKIYHGKSWSANRSGTVKGIQTHFQSITHPDARAVFTIYVQRYD